MITLPAGSIEQPLLPGADVARLIAGLAPHVPATASWAIRPPRR